MPKDAISISSSVTLTPVPEEHYNLLIAGNDGTTDSYGPVKYESKEEVENDTDLDSTDNLEAALLNAFDEGLTKVWGYVVPLGAVDSYPSDIVYSNSDETVDDMESDFVNLEHIDITAFVGLDPILSDATYSGSPGLLDIVKGVNSVMLTDTSYTANESSWSLSDSEQDRAHFVTAHESGDATIGNIAGAFAEVEPNDKLMWKEVESLDSGPGYVSSEIDDIESININALMEMNDNVVFSNGYSTSTAEGYKWIDITRSEYYMKGVFDSYLSTFIADTNIPYTSEGLSMVESQIASVCRNLRGDEYINNYRIEMPSIESLSASNKDNRTVPGITVVLDVPGHIQMLEIDMEIQI